MPGISGMVVHIYLLFTDPNTGASIMVPHCMQGTFNMVLPPLLSWGIVSIQWIRNFPRRHPPQYCQSITFMYRNFFLKSFPIIPSWPPIILTLTSSYYPDLSSSYCSNLSSFYYPTLILYHPDPLLELVHALLNLTSNIADGVQTLASVRDFGLPTIRVRYFR